MTNLDNKLLELRELRLAAELELCTKETDGFSADEASDVLRLQGMVSGLKRAISIMEEEE